MKSSPKIPARPLPLALACAALLAPAEAAAQAPNHPGWAFGAPTGEALFALAAGLSNLTGKLPQVETGWGPDAPHPYSKAADRASDVTGAYGGATIAMLAGLGLEAGYFGESGVRGGPVYALRTSLVDLESAFFARGVVDALKRLTGRCRPHELVGGACTSEVRDAFPSGHTAPMGALAGARLVLSLQTTGPSGYRWGSFALAESMALATGVLRVSAGKHSWSDVAAGFVIGHLVGVLVGLAHPMQEVPAGDLRQAGSNGEGSTGQGGYGLFWSGVF